MSNFETHTSLKTFSMCNQELEALEAYNMLKKN